MMKRINPQLEKIIRGYSFYAASSLLRLAVFYYIAVQFHKSAFIMYNKYVFYSEIAMTIVCSGTCTAFTVKHGPSNKLAPAVLFENIYLLIVFFIFLVIYLLKLFTFQVSFPLLAIIIIARTNNQIFSRFYLFEKTIFRSILNDIIGNYLWAILVLIAAIFYHFENINVFIIAWSSILILNGCYNFYSYRRMIFNLEAIKDLRFFSSMYLQSIQFTIVNTLFGNVDKVIVIHKFSNLAVVSGYLIASKVIGFFTDISTGFTGLFLTNNLKKMDKQRSGRNNFFLMAFSVNGLAFIGIFFIIFLFSPIVQSHLSTQLAPEYTSLMFWVIPIYAMNNLRGLNGIYFQRHNKMKYLNLISVFQVSVLVMLYLIHVNIFHYILFETVSIFLFLVFDAFFWHRIESQKAGAY